MGGSAASMSPFALGAISEVTAPMKNVVEGAVGSTNS